MGKQQETILPSSTSNKELANEFSKFFVNKVALIREELRKLTTFNIETSLSMDNPFSGDPLLSFRHTIKYEVKAIHGKAVTKACVLEPIPTSILKKNLDVVVPFITNIIIYNMSFGLS